VATLPEPCRRIYRDHRERLLKAPGSKHKHQAWEGGYADHVAEICELAADMHGLWQGRRPLPFSLTEAQTVLFLHDLEKPFKYTEANSEQEERRKQQAAADPHGFVDALIDEYSVELSDEQRNALTYIHGEPDSEYSATTRVSGRLAAFCHCCDYLSARLWFDQPGPAEC
jgi:hypothetical protein